MNTNRFGAQHIDQRAYFDVFTAIHSDMTEEIERAKSPGISIELESDGIHNRGWHYKTYLVTSRRPFDPRVDEIADRLHALSARLFRQILPGNANSVDLF